MSAPSFINPHRYGVFPLREKDREDFVAHLLSLDAAARRTRFGVALQDETVEAIARKLPLERAGLGLFIWGKLKGCAHLVPAAPHIAELAISLDPSMRGRGWGKLLVDQVLSRAQDQNLQRVEIQYLRENAPMHRIARTLPGGGWSESSEVCKHVDVQLLEPEMA